MDLNEIPALPGSYALHLSLDRPLTLRIGSLGNFTFPAANYLYLGSAWGPGGLKARLQRHILGAARPHWHIDTFRSAAVLESVFFLVSPQPSSPSHARLECVWSQAADAEPSAFIPSPGFGASDCRQGCPAHLVGLVRLPNALAALLVQSAGVRLTSIHFVHIT